MDQPDQEDSGAAHRSSRARLSEEQAAAVRQGNAEGRSLRSIARDIGADPATVSRWAKREGLLWPRAERTAAASEAVAIRLAEQRQDLAERALADALAMRERLWEPGIEHIATAGGVEEIETDLPSPRAVRDLADAIERLTRVAENAAHLSDTARIADARSMLGRLSAQIGEYVDALDDGADNRPHD